MAQVRNLKSAWEIFLHNMIALAKMDLHENRWCTQKIDRYTAALFFFSEEYQAACQFTNKPPSEIQAEKADARRVMRELIREELEDSERKKRVFLFRPTVKLDRKRIRVL